MYDNIPKIAIPTGKLRCVLEEALNRMGYSYPEGRRLISDPYSFNLKDGTKKEFCFLVQKPKNSPELLQKGEANIIAGISGNDCYIECLKMKINGNIEENSQNGLKRRGLEELANLGFRPANVVLATHKNLPVNSLEKFIRRYSNGSSVKGLASEFYNIARNYVENNSLNVEDIKATEGTTESYLHGFVEAIIDIAETGETIRENDGKILGIIFESTPRLVARKEALKNGCGNFLREFAEKLNVTICQMSKEQKYEDYFKTKKLKLASEREKS